MIPGFKPFTVYRFADNTEKMDALNKQILTLLLQGYSRQ